MTDFALAGNCGGFGGERIERDRVGERGVGGRRREGVSEASRLKQRPEGERAEAAAGAIEEIAAGVGRFVMRGAVGVADRAVFHGIVAVSSPEVWRPSRQSTYNEFVGAEQGVAEVD